MCSLGTLLWVCTVVEGFGGFRWCRLVVGGFCVFWRLQNTFLLLQNQPWNNLPPCPAHLCCRWSPKGTEITKKRAGNMFRREKKVVLPSFCGWSSVGKVSEYFVTCCHRGFAVGGGMHCPDSQARPTPKSPMGWNQHSSRMRALGAHPGTPGAGNTPVLPFGRCGFQTDGQCWVVERCRAHLASLGQHRTGAVNSHQHIVGSIPPHYMWEEWDLWAFFAIGDLRKFAWEKVVGQELNMGL